MTSIKPRVRKRFYVIRIPLPDLNPQINCHEDYRNPSSRLGVKIYFFSYKTANRWQRYAEMIANKYEHMYLNLPIYLRE